MLVLGTVAFPIVGLLRLRLNGNLFPGTLVNLWLAWLLFSALASGPQECNSLFDSGMTTFIQILSHLVWTYMVIFGMALKDDSNEEKAESNDKVEDDDTAAANATEKVQEKNTEAKDDLEKEGGEDSDKEKEKDGDEVFVFPVTRETIWFQSIVLIACCHYAMVMTNWGNPVVNNDVSNYFAASGASFGIKVGMWVVSLTIYLVSQLLVCCYPDRF